MTGAGTRSQRLAAAGVLALLLVAVGCSGGDGGDGAVATSTSPAPASASTSASPSTASAGTAAPTGGEQKPPSVPPTSAGASTGPTAPPATTAPEDVGVPGLDSDDVFCAAWSRFGGSWQVTLAASAFGEPGDAARLEVMAAPTVADAYATLLEAWPEEIAVERDVVAEEYFGAFQRRSAAALDELVQAGAQDDELTALEVVWVEALARRDPGTPVLSVDLPPELAALVGDAAAAFSAARVPLTADPSMVITADTPLTDDFLVTACPDQGSIVGGEVAG